MTSNSQCYDKSPIMADSERTPLIATVRIAPPHQRYPHHVLRRFCTIALFSTAIVVFTLFLLPVALLPSSEWLKHTSSYLPFGSDLWPSANLAYPDLLKILLDTPKEDNAREWSRYYTSGPHLAGKNFSQALWTKEKWDSWGIKSEIVSYDVYVNYPVGHRLALLEKKKTKDAKIGEMVETESWKVEFEATLEEDVLDEDETSGLKDRVMTFHGYSASGNVTAPFVYANYGTYQDYEDLLDANITVKDHIVLVKYGGIFRGLKVKRAQELGAVGVVMYSDPGDDFGVTEENGHKAYPDGPAREASSVQRGSVQFLSKKTLANTKLTANRFLQALHRVIQPLRGILHCPAPHVLTPT
jgi:N-acetylated-alpha-linked acidic dipeptidase